MNSRAGARAEAGVCGGEGMLLFGKGHVNTGLKCPSEVLLHRNAQKGSSKLSCVPFFLHLLVVSPSGRTQVVEKSCSQSLEVSHG